jgi:hypothetical protein
MADDKRKAGRQDRQQVNVHEEYELRDLSKRLGGSKDEAVQKVGASAAARWDTGSKEMSHAP